MKFTPEFVQTIADLANLDIDEKQRRELAKSFTDSMAIVSELNQIDTTNVPPTYQVNNLLNVMRPDKVEKKFEFSKSEALANARATHQGYFVVDRVLDHEA